MNATITAASVFTLTALTSSSTASLCPGTKTIAVNVFYNPTITAVAQRTTIICLNESVNLIAGGGDTYLWNTGDNTATVTVKPKSNITYTVTGTDINGCVSTGTVLVKVSSCSGVDELTGANIGLTTYPNPNNGDFILQASTDLNLTLVNDIGQVIRLISLSETNSYKVYVNDLAKGIYFLTGQKGNLQISQKVVVIK